jgi:hypothetical protein
MLLAADTTSIYLGSVAPFLLFAGAILSQYMQNRALRSKLAQSKEEGGDARLLQLAKGLQTQADTNYKAYQDALRAQHFAENARQAQYVKLLEAQDALFDIRQKYFALKNKQEGITE